MKNLLDSDDERLIARVLVRGLLNIAREDINSAESQVRKNRLEGDPDDPDSIRKLRLAFRRIEYQLETMGDVDESLAVAPLARQLHEIARPLGRLRDVEILESRVVKSLGPRAATPEGRRLLEVVADGRHDEQRATDAVLDSSDYRATLEALNASRLLLPSDAVTPTMARPVVQKVIRESWRRLRHVVKRAKVDSSDDDLHLVRRTVKRTVYSTRAFSYVLGPSSEEFTDRLATLQKILGRQHDHVIIAAWMGEQGDEHASLTQLTEQLGAEERRRADKYTNDWVRYWRAVRDLHPRETVLTTYSFFD